MDAISVDGKKVDVGIVCVEVIQFKLLDEVGEGDIVRGALVGGRMYTAYVIGGMLVVNEEDGNE